MKHIQRFLATLQGFTGTIRRFPITILFFFLSAILTSYYIGTSNIDKFSHILFSFILGAAIFMVLQLFYERFISRKGIRIVFCGLALLAALIYYLLLVSIVKEFDTETAIRTIVILFILLIAFIWIPAIKAKIGFSECFMAVFKGFFTVAFYAGVMFLGIALILGAIDMLIADIDGEVYRHALTWIAFLYAPIHFLSLIPIYPAFSHSHNNEKEDMVIGNNEELAQRLNKAIEPTKFLEGLISFIIIPITAIFTVILLLYIVINITGDFWKDNLLESLLVTYSITVITVYLLASVIKNKVAIYFRKIFPKVLVPVVLFQTISSILKIGELGITAGRYYVILFGIFATISAIIFTFRPNHKTNIIAPILIICSLISIIPPADAFFVSKKNQIGRLTKVLKENDMLVDDKLIPNAELPYEDRQIIINTIQYLSSMGYTKDINFLKNYSQSHNFEETFGFPQYGSGIKDPVITRLYMPEGTPIEVSGYDLFLEAELYGDDNQRPFELSLWDDKDYTLVYEIQEGIGDLLIMDGQDNELIRYPLSNIYDSFKDRSNKFGEITPEEARFITENENAILCVITKAINYEVWDYGSFKNIEAYIMVKIK